MIPTSEPLPSQYQFTPHQRRTLEQTIPDVLLPGQVPRAEPAQPERALWSAVLYGAINEAAGRATYSSGDERRHGRERFRMSHEADARAWIADVDTEGVGSFPWVCAQLNINPDYLRGRLQTKDHAVKWTKRFAGCRNTNRTKKVT